MNVTAALFKKTLKNIHFLSQSLFHFLPILSVSIILIFPSVARTTDIHTQSLSKVTTGHGQDSVPSVIHAFYDTLFIQTWEQAPDIQIAKNLQEQKSAEKYSAWAKRLAPQLNLELSQKQFFNKNISSTSVATADDKANYKDGRDVTDWSFDLDIPLYRRALSVAMDISTLEHDLAVNNLEIKTRELDSILHELLSNYMVACYNLLNLKNSVRISREHVAKIQRGYDLRDQTKLALLRAQANLKELEAREDLNEQKRDTAFRKLLDYTTIPEHNSTWHRLAKLLDTEEHTAACINSFSALKKCTEKMKPFLANSVADSQLRDFFLDNSLLYKKILLEQDLEKTKSSRQTQEEWPSLFVRGELDRKDNTRFSDYSGEGSIGLVIRVPLFSGGTVFSNMKAQDMASKIAAIQEHTDTLRTFNSIANKKKTITSLQNIFQKQLIHLQQQQEIVRLSLKSYQIKQTSMQDLLTSKNRLIDAKNLLMRTTADLGILLRQFAWELGTPFPAPAVPHGIQ